MKEITMSTIETDKSNIRKEIEEIQMKINNGERTRENLNNLNELNNELMRLID